jgi:hypothetical protein
MALVSLFYSQSGKSFRSSHTTFKLGASLTLLDDAATAVVSSASAAAYLSGEVPRLPFAPAWIAIAIIVVFTVLSLLGVRESSTMAFGILAIHVRLL